MTTIIRDLLKTTYQIYKNSFKICFALAFVLSFITQYSMNIFINSDLFTFLKENPDKDLSSLPNADQIVTLGILSIVATLIIYALITIVAGVQYNQNDENKLTTLEVMRISLKILRNRFFKALGVFVLLAVCSSFIISIFATAPVIGVWFMSMIFLTVIPAVLIGNERIFQAFQNNIMIIKTNFQYMIVASFLIILIYSINLALALIMQADGYYSTIENIISIFFGAFTTPYIFSIAIAVYINHYRDLSLQGNEK